MAVHPGPVLAIWPHESPFSVLDCALLALLRILDSGYPKAKLHGLSSPSTHEWLSHSSKWRKWDINTLNTARDDVTSAFVQTTGIDPRFADVFSFFLKDAISIVACCCGAYLHFEEEMPICSDATHSITYFTSKFLENILPAVCLLISMSNRKEPHDSVAQPNNSTQDLEFALDPSCPPVVLVRVEPCSSETDCDILIPRHINASPHLEYELAVIIWEGPVWVYHADVMVDRRVWRYSATSGGKPEVYDDRVLMDDEMHLKIQQDRPHNTHLSTLLYVHSHYGPALDGSGIIHRTDRAVGGGATYQPTEAIKSLIEAIWKKHFNAIGHN